MYYISMLLIILSSVFYHISQKTINQNANPAISMIASYGVALILSIILLFIFPVKDFTQSFKELNLSSYLLGITIVGIEIGFLFAYRTGWNINIASLLANVLLAMILILIGVYFFKENISPINFLGILLSIVGLILINK